MARSAQDREDLLRDATAYVSRVQLRFATAERQQIVFAGFRASGAASLFFDQDPVYHFNVSGQLRRAFVDDLLIKAEHGRLIQWQRQQREQEVAMLRKELNDEHQQDFCTAVLTRFSSLQQALASGNYTVDGQINAAPDEDLISHLQTFLQHFTTVEIASSPRVNG